MLSTERFIVFVTLYYFRNIVDAMARRVWVILEGVELLLLRHLSHELF